MTQIGLGSYGNGFCDLGPAYEVSGLAACYADGPAASALPLTQKEALSNQADVPASKLHYHRKIVPLAYGQGPFYLFGPLKKSMIALLGLFRIVPRGPASKADMRVWAHKSTALACENLMLSLRAFGFDSCPMEGMDERRIQKLLDLPRAAEVCMVISAGKRSEHGIYNKQFRLDPSLHIFEVSLGKVARRSTSRITAETWLFPNHGCNQNERCAEGTRACSINNEGRKSCVDPATCHQREQHLLLAECPNEIALAHFPFTNVNCLHV